MYERISNLLRLIAFILIVFTSSNIQSISAKDNSASNRLKADRTVKKIDPAAIRVVDYSFPDEHNSKVNQEKSTRSLSSSSIQSTGFGQTIGSTWYEYQNNYGSARQIEWGSSIDCPWTLHFTWMNLNQPLLVDRFVSYNFYEGSTGYLDFGYNFQGIGEFAGYPSLDVTDDNRAVVTMHNNINDGARYRIHTFWQLEWGISFFLSNVKVPDSLADQGNTHIGDTFSDDVIWPVIAVQNPPDGDPVLHLIGSVIGGGLTSETSLHYFQGIGVDAAVTWSYGNAIDTVHIGEAYDLAASEDGTVAIVWSNLIPSDQATCDTCSQNFSTGDVGRDKWDNDIYYQINRNYGRGYLGDLFNGTTNWWENRVNMTNYSDVSLWGSIDGSRAFGDMSTLISPSGDLHILYVAMVWDDDNFGTYQSRLFQWGENLPKYSIRTVSNALWDPVNCNAGPANQNQNKPSLSWCDNKFYAFWVEGNSPLTTGNQNNDDCADRAISDTLSTGAANGDIFMSVSDGDGIFWDSARAVTDTYGGPTDNPNGACDPNGPGGPCPAEHWVSTSTYGSNYPVTLPTTSNVVDIDPGYIGDDYIDLLYVDDPEPGGAVLGYGAWHYADLNWMRIPCVDPIPSCNLDGGFVVIDGYVSSHSSLLATCQEDTTSLVFEYSGIGSLPYTVDVVEDNGPTGWLGVSKLSGSMSNIGTEIIELYLNDNGVICAPGIVEYVSGTVNINITGGLCSSKSFTVELLTGDPLPPLVWDTIATDCLSLVVANNGNAGSAGTGEVNMDYIGSGEWKSSADVYLYDGSLIAGWIDGIDTNMYYGMFTAGAGIATPHSMIPVGAPSSGVTSWGTVVSTGEYKTLDSTLLFRTNWYSDTSTPNIGISNCGFLFKETIVTAPNGATNVILGEAVDFDVPADSSNANNISGDGTNGFYSWVYQQGVEIPGWNDTSEGWNADERFSALVFLEAYKYDGSGSEIDYINSSSFHSMYTADNPTYVYPFTYGFDAGLLYQNHVATPGISHYESGAEDLHSGLTYVANYDIGPNDTVYLYSFILTRMNSGFPARGSAGLAESINAAIASYEENLMHESSSCCDLAGDFDGSGGVDIADLTATVNWMFKGGAPADCANDADVDASCDADIADLTYRVNYMFKGGDDLVCGCVE